MMTVSNGGFAGGPAPAPRAPGPRGWVLESKRSPAISTRSTRPRPRPGDRDPERRELAARAEPRRAHPDPCAALPGGRRRCAEDEAIGPLAPPSPGPLSFERPVRGGRLRSLFDGYRRLFRPRGVCCLDGRTRRLCQVRGRRMQLVEKTSRPDARTPQNRPASRSGAFAEVGFRLLRGLRRFRLEARAAGGNVARSGVMAMVSSALPVASHAGTHAGCLQPDSLQASRRATERSGTDSVSLPPGPIGADNSSLRRRKWPTRSTTPPASTACRVRALGRRSGVLRSERVRLGTQALP